MNLIKAKSIKLGLVSAIALLSSSVTLANTQPTPPPAPVQVDTVTEISIAANAKLTATLHSQSHVPITAGVSGYLEWIVEPGTVVQQGDSLIKLDLLPLELQRAEQQAQIKRAKINVKYLKNETKRLEKLRKTNAASQFQLDQSQSQYEIALADIEIAQVKLRQIDDQIKRANVTAPFDGVVTERMIRAGTDINRSDVLVRLLDTEHLEARVFVPVKYLSHISKGLRLTLEATNQTLTVPISAVIPSADPRSQTFEVRMKIPSEANEYWTAGQLVNAIVPTQGDKPSLTVHRDALLLRKDGTYVVTIDDDNKAHRQQVTVGKGTFDRVSVSGKLKQGDKVAIRGAERLREGQTVSIQN